MTLLLSDRARRVRRPAKAPPTGRPGVKEKDIDLSPILRADATHHGPAAEAVSIRSVIGDDLTGADASTGEALRSAGRQYAALDATVAAGARAGF